MAEQNSTNLGSVLDGARSELRDRHENYRDEFGPRGDDASDVIHEIADSSIPVYTCDLLSLACGAPSLATDEPEIVGAEHFGTALSIIVGNLYERLSAALFEEWESMHEEVS